jgi:hypothetical protein
MFEDLKLVEAMLIGLDHLSFLRLVRTNWDWWVHRGRASWGFGRAAARPKIFDFNRYIYISLQTFILYMLMDSNFYYKVTLARWLSITPRARVQLLSMPFLAFFPIFYGHCYKKIQTPTWPPRKFSPSSATVGTLYNPLQTNIILKEGKL